VFCDSVLILLSDPTLAFEAYKLVVENTLVDTPNDALMLFTTDKLPVVILEAYTDMDELCTD